MIVRIPSKFIQQDNTESIKEFYINTNSLQYFEVVKRAEEIWDRVEKKYTGEFETRYYISMMLMNGNYVPFDYNMNETVFQEFIL